MLGTEKRKRSKRKKNVDQGEVRQTDGPRAVIQYDARKQWALVVASEAGEEGGGERERWMWRERKKCNLP